MSTTNSDTLRNEIDALLKKCTPKQQEFLHRIHMNAPWRGLGNCPDDKLHPTYELIQRTVKSNETQHEH